MKSEKCYLSIAIEQAEKAARKGEVPIGAIIVREDKIVARAHNMREKKQNALYHAEILAINRACKKLKSWRLDDCDMYVTLEPCPMCMGAITNARIRTVYVGARSTTDLNWKSTVEFLDNEQCGKLLKDFFASKR